MNKLGQFLGAAAVIAIAVVFIVQFRPGTGAQQVAANAPTCAAEIKGSCISSTHFWAAYHLMAPRGADTSFLKAMRLRTATMEGLIERWLLLEDAKRLGVTVSDDDITAELVAGRAHVSLPSEQAQTQQLTQRLFLGEGGVRRIEVEGRQTKKFDRKTYEKEIRYITKMSPTDFRDFQRDELIAARMRDLVRARVHVSDAEAFAQYAREKSTATIKYARFDRRFYAEVAIDDSTKAVDAWAEKNKPEVDKIWEQRKSQFLPECRALRHILVKVDPDASDAAEQKDKAKKRLLDAKARLGKGESFADLAKEMSDDGSASHGGDLGCVTKGRMVKPFEDAAFALAKAGDVSDVVESEFGMHLIKLDQIAKDADAEKIGRAQTAKDLYLAQEGERMAAEGAKQVLAAVRGGKSLDDAIKAHLAALPKPHEDRKKTDDKKKPGDNKKKPGDKGEEKEPVTAENHPARPAVETSLPFNASGDPIPGARGDKDVAELAFKLAKPGDVPDDVVQIETGYVVFQLDAKTPASQDQWPENRERFVSSMRTNKQGDALIAYLKRLREQVASDIKTNSTFTTEPKDKDEPEVPVDVGDE